MFAHEEFLQILLMAPSHEQGHDSLIYQPVTVEQVLRAAHQRGVEYDEVQARNFADYANSAEAHALMLSLNDALNVRMDAYPVTSAKMPVRPVPSGTTRESYYIPGVSPMLADSAMLLYGQGKRSAKVNAIQVLIDDVGIYYLANVLLPLQR